MATITIPSKCAPSSSSLVKKEGLEVANPIEEVVPFCKDHWAGVDLPALSECSLISEWEKFGRNLPLYKGETGPQIPRLKKYLTKCGRKTMKIEDIGEEIRCTLATRWDVLTVTIVKVNEALPSGVKLWSAGGIVNQLVDPLPLEKKLKYAKECHVNCTQPDDIDLYLVGAKVESTMLNIVVNAIRSCGAPTEIDRISYFARNSFALTIVLSEEGKKVFGVKRIQVILVKAKTIGEVLNWFDVDCCAVALTMIKSKWNSNKIELVGLPRAIRAIKNRINIYREGLVTPSYAHRILKYMSRGYDFALAGYYDTSMWKHYVTHTKKFPENGFISLVTGERNRGMIVPSNYAGPDDMHTDCKNYVLALQSLRESRARSTHPACVSRELKEMLSGEDSTWLQTYVCSESGVGTSSSSPITNGPSEAFLVSMLGNAHTLGLWGAGVSDISISPELAKKAKEALISAGVIEDPSITKEKKTKIAMVTLPPIGFYLTPEELKKEANKEYDMSAWPKYGVTDIY